MVSDTKPSIKICSRCSETKDCDSFMKNRNICKDCRNKKNKKSYNETEIAEKNKHCNTCNQTKPITCFIRKRLLCKDCNNQNRRIRYQTNEEHRAKLINMATIFKHNKVVERQKIKQEEQEKIGIDNKKCLYCDTIKLKTCFRYNRLKCKDCERDNPVDKLKRIVRSRIHISLKSKKNHTIEYLGCDYNNYLQWLLGYDEKYNMENRGKEWHIDHVIPLSKFDLDNEDEHVIAFNWRNTMPLSVKENLSKNNKIIKSQIQTHLTKLLEYHEKNNIEMPEKFIELFAKHLDAGNPLEPSLPLLSGNIQEELG